MRSLGDVLRGLGKFQDSEEVLQQSLAVVKRERSRSADDRPSPKDETATLLSLGNTARAQQHNQEALAYYQQAAALDSPPTIKIQVQLNQLNIFLQQKQWSEIQTLLPQIKSELPRLPASRATVYTRINLAQTLICLNHQDLTQIEKEQLAPIFQQCPTPEKENSRVKGKITTKSASSIPSELKSAESEIVQLLSTAVRQAASLQDPRAEAYALGYLGGLYQQHQQWADAQKVTQKALKIAEAINSPDIAYRWQWQLGRILKATGKNTEAIAAYSQALNNLKLLRNNLAAINPDVQFSFRDSVEPVYRELVSLLLQPGDNRDTQENISQARDVIESLQLAEIQNFFRQACLDTQPVKIDQVERTAAVIYPIILSDRLEVILALPGRPLRHYATILPPSIDRFAFSVVHLATHGQFSSNPQDTFILIWNQRLNIQQLEDILQTRDLNQPSNPIELLVLSACETASGDNRAALGLAGVAVRSGARSTLATLWPVNDESTASAMVEFYKELAKPGVNKAEALRRAQVMLLKQPQFRHPYYWAPFVLVGNWL